MKEVKILILAIIGLCGCLAQDAMALHKENPTQPQMAQLTRELAHCGKIYGFMRHGSQIYGAIYYRQGKYFYGTFDSIADKPLYERRVIPHGKGGKEWSDKAGSYFFIDSYGWIEQCDDDERDISDYEEAFLLGTNHIMDDPSNYETIIFDDDEEDDDVYDD